jgi:hypothetical protein
MCYSNILQFSPKVTYKYIRIVLSQQNLNQYVLPVETHPGKVGFPNGSRIQPGSLLTAEPKGEKLIY